MSPFTATVQTLVGPGTGPPTSPAPDEGAQEQGVERRG